MPLWKDQTETEVQRFCVLSFTGDSSRQLAGRLDEELGDRF